MNHATPRWMILGLGGLLAVIVGCSRGKPAKEKEKTTTPSGTTRTSGQKKALPAISAKRIAAQYEKDRTGTNKKYADKTLTVTGRVAKFKTIGANNTRGFLLEGGVTPKKGATWSGNVYCSDFKMVNPWAKAMHGQMVTVRGKWPRLAFLGPELQQCEILDVKGDAIQFTAEQIGKLIETDLAAMIAKYDGKHVALSGVVSKVELSADSKFIYDVELKYSGTCVIRVSKTASQLVSANEFKVGDTIKVIGEFRKGQIDKNRMTLDNSWYVGKQ